MKKLLMVMSLGLMLMTSVVAGTLASYNVAIDNAANGDVVAKEFKVTAQGIQGFESGVKIAPNESVSMIFEVANYDGNIISETAMDLSFKVEVKAQTGKKAILPLVISINKVQEAIKVGEQINGIGETNFANQFALSTEKQTLQYEIVIYWVGDDSTDILYAGADFGSSIKVSLVATQK